MMEFVRWGSIENSYRQKEIARWVEHCPDLINDDTRYIITEKLHGSNIVVAASPAGDMYYGSRNQWIPADDTFFGCFPRDIEKLIPNWEWYSPYMRKMADMVDQDVCLYGELFGPGIQKGVQYGNTKQILWFGLRVGDTIRPFDELLTLFGNTVPVVARARGLSTALEFDTVFPSMLVPEPDNLCEGIVIVPEQPVRSQDSWFMLKKKNEKFAERAHAKKERVPDEVADPLNAAFRTYITPARMQSVFSKDGPIEDRKDIGRYIKAILADAKEDFLKDCPEVADLDKAQQKTVFNVGSMIAKMLMAEI